MAARCLRNPGRFSWCFRSNGIYKSSISAIANHAAVSRGAVYWHFKNKEEMLAAVLERGLVSLPDRLDKVAHGPLPMLPALYDCVAQLSLDIQNTPHIREALEVVFRHGDFSGDCGPAWPTQQEMDGLTWAALTVIFSRAAQAGEIRSSAVGQATTVTMLVLSEILRTSTLSRPQAKPGQLNASDPAFLTAWIRRIL